MLGALYDRRDEITLESLVVRSCNVYDRKYEEWVRELVEKVIWDDVTVIELSDDDLYSETESRDEYGDESEDEWNFLRWL